MKRNIIITTIVFIGLFIAIITILPKCKPKHKYKPPTSVTIKLPYTFKTEKAEQLSIMAFNLRKAKNYEEAINMYRQAIKVEPENPKLFFDLSECYTSTDRPEQAILLLDTAIILDKSCAAFYNNRGLIYWRLYKDQNAINDYKKAIQLDSTNWVFYSNIAMAYYSDKKIPEACKAFQMAKYLGLDMTNLKENGNLEILKSICY